MSTSMITMDEMRRGSGGKWGDSKQQYGNQFWFPGNSCLSTFCRWTEAGEGVVFIHKLSGHMKCLVTHVTDLGRYPTSHNSKNTPQDHLGLFSTEGLNSTNWTSTPTEARHRWRHSQKHSVFILFG